MNALKSQLEAAYKRSIEAFTAAHHSQNQEQIEAARAGFFACRENLATFHMEQWMRAGYPICANCSGRDHAGQTCVEFWKQSALDAERAFLIKNS